MVTISSGHKKDGHGRLFYLQCFDCILNRSVTGAHHDDFADGVVGIQNICQDLGNVRNWVSGFITWAKVDLPSTRFLSQDRGLDDRVVQVGALDQVVVGEELGNVVVGDGGQSRLICPLLWLQGVH